MVEWWGRNWAQGNWGDLASLASLFITLIGFLITFWNLRKTRTEVKRIRSLFYSIDTLTELSATLAMMDELKFQHRKGEWDVILPRYSELRRKLVLIRNSDLPFTDFHQQVLQDTVTLLKSMEEDVEAALAHQSRYPDYSRLNRSLSEQMDQLAVVLAAFKRMAGG